MNRIEKTFAALKEENRTAFIPFIMAGDPDADTSLEILKSLPDAGADLIEIGMPFTDPAADGPAVQLAGQRALQGGANMNRTLEMIKSFREDNTETPIILMGYYNPIFIYDTQRFVKNAVQAGADGVIIVDLPPEESTEFATLCGAGGLDFIRLITPVTTGARIAKITNEASGFLYYVSITGVTGAAKADLSVITPHIEEIRTHTDLPIAIGFGIKTPQDAAHMAKLGDAVVVGSALAETILQNKDNSGLLDIISSQIKDLSAAAHK